MKLIKYTICTNGWDEIIYCANGTKIDDKNCDLLGFFLNRPVLGNGSMTRDVDQKGAPLEPHINRVIKDNNTGDKFLYLNGKKLKILPSSKILKGMVNLKVASNKNSIIHLNSKNVNIIGEESNKNVRGLSSEKRHIVNYNIDKINTVNKDKISGISGVTSSQECNREQINSPLISPNKLETVRYIKLKPSNMQALDLSKDNLVTVKTENVGTSSKPKTADAEVQTEPITILDDILLDTSFSLNLFDEVSDFPSLDSPGATIADDTPKTKVSPSCLQLYKELHKALQSNDQGNMPIHVSVVEGDLKALKRSWLILKSIEQPLDLPNTADQTALQLAVLSNANSDIISYLISEGANLDQTDSDGNHIIHLAVECEFPDPLLVILKNDAVNIDVFNNEGLTPLMICCLNKRFKFAQILLDHDANVNIRDLISGRTALFHAAERHDVEMVKLLLRYKADTKIKNFFGISPHDAMYEIDEMPEEIKTLILGKLWKKRTYEEPNDNSRIKRKQVRALELKTYSKYQKIAKDIKIMKVT